MAPFVIRLAISNSRISKVQYDSVIVSLQALRLSKLQDLHPTRRGVYLRTSRAIDFRCGSQPEVSQGRGNVRFRGYSGSRFWATECLLVAEGVEEVPRVRNFETIIQNPGRY